IVARLVTDSCARAVSRDDARVRVERVDLLLDRSRDRRKVAAGKIGAADRALKQRVAREQERPVRRLDAEAAAPRRVARRVDDLGVALAERQRLPVAE